MMSAMGLVVISPEEEPAHSPERVVSSDDQTYDSYEEYIRRTSTCSHSTEPDDSADGRDAEPRDMEQANAIARPELRL